MVKNHWFYKRLLISYIPIIFAICTILVLLIVIGFNQLSREAARKESLIIAQYIMAEIDNELLEVKKGIEDELLNKGKFMRIFRLHPTISAYHEIYELSVMLRDVTNKYPAIHSIYVYRKADGTIQSASGVERAERFGDRNFIHQVGSMTDGDANENEWSEIRPFKEFEGQPAVDVTSLTRSIPISTYSGGYLVVNVSTQHLREIVGHLSNLEHTSVIVSDPNGSPLLLSATDNVKVDAVYRSPASGYMIQLGFRESLLHGIMNTITVIYVVIGFMVFVAGMIWLIYTTRKTYQPVHSIMAKLDSISADDRAISSRVVNRFGMVEEALERLIDRSTQFERQQKENTVIKRRVFYSELREGCYAGTAEGLRRQLREFGWDAGSDGFMMAVMEIDGFDDFTERFNARDQSLLKYAISQVMMDISESGRHPQPWADWLSSNQIALLYPVNRSGQGSLNVVTYDLHVAVEWISKNLKTTVSIGIGSPAWEAEQIHASYEEALQLLKFKFTLGDNRIIGYWEVDRTDPSGHARMIAPTRDLARSICQAKPDWRAQFDQWYEGLMNWVATKEDVDRLMDGLIYYFRLEVSQLSGELSEQWRQEHDNRLVLAVRESRSIRELGDRLRGLCEGVDRRFTEIRESKRNSNIMQDIRAFVDAHYADPDLSLEYLSAKFDMNSKTLSRLFKEQFGVNFVDYMIRTRIEKSKPLLLESDESIQNISRRVGYQNSVSFTRAFKKLEGVTPLDLRRA